MKNVEKHIADIVSKVLNEQVVMKTEQIMSMAHEELHGGQKRIDKNKNGKIDSEDFKMLRKNKKSSEMGENSGKEPLYRGTKFVDESEIEEYSFGDTATDDDLGYNDMLPSAKYEKEVKTPHKVKNVGDKYQRKVSKEFNEENIFKKMFGKKEDPEVVAAASQEKDRKETPYLGNIGYDYDDIRGWHYVGPGQGRFDKKDSEDAEMEEGNEFSGALADAKKRGEKSFEVDGKTYPVKESIQLTEDELIELIENIVKETNASLKKSKTENDDYIKSVTEKMKKYLKDGSKGKYDMNPEQFPKGNGELAKMSKKAYTPSKAVEEYIENFVYSPGMENLEYEIKPNDEWLEKNIEGSSMTGNGKGGNAIDTGLGKKINAKRKKNLYGVEKNRSYNRVAQPVVDNAGEDTHSNTLDSIFKKLGESDEKKTKLINEEMEKMKHLLGYKKKTQ